MTAREIAEPTTILRCEAGSSVFGLSLDATSDRDELGVCLESAEYVIGLRRFEQWVHRTAVGVERSGPGDLDLTVYSLRKWASLALKGNPTVLLLLFVPRDRCVVWTPAAERLQAMAPAFASRRAGTAFLGYMTQQRLRLLGERGQRNVKRPELEAAHGFDTKYAGHIMRLGFQGIEYLRTGRISVPMDESAAALVRGVRRGEYRLDEVVGRAELLEGELEDLLFSSPLPADPDRDAVDRWLVAEYLDSWR